MTDSCLQAFEKLGLSAEELAPFFSGPAFMPWQRMGNEAGWGGPLTPAYQAQAHELQIRILGRAIALGMTVVLPCFGGNVPAAMHKHYPTANLKPFPAWNGFPNESMLLDPTDPLFVTVGSAFVEAQKELYTAAGVWPEKAMWNCDVWMNDRHTWEPASSSPEYLSAAGEAMVKQLAPAGDAAVWLSQGGWMFHYPWWQSETTEANDGVKSGPSLVNWTRLHDTDTALGTRAICGVSVACGERSCVPPHIKAPPCDIAALEALCSRTPHCAGFNSDGWLKPCVAEACGARVKPFPGVDTYVASSVMPGPFPPPRPAPPPPPPAGAKGKRVYDYLSKVPANRTLILELSADKGPTVFDMTYSPPGGGPYKSDYWGKPWVWCLLHNYGQRPGMYGDFDMIATQPAAAFAQKGGTMHGIGITPEGIQQNPVVYEMMFETAWRGRFNVSIWLDAYATRRYATAGDHPPAQSPAANLAWKTLYADCYSGPGDSIPFSALSSPPSLTACTPAGHGCHADTATRPHGRGLARGWLQLQTAATVDLGVSVAATSQALVYDIVDVGRGSLSDFFNQVHVLLSSEFHNFAASKRPPASVRAMVALAQSLLYCLQRLDEFLGTSPDFLLGRWLAAARAAATSAAEADIFEFGARNQLMMWGPTPEVGPNPDYACKHWSGLVGRYYYQRWATFLNIVVNQTVIPGRPLPPTAGISAKLDALAQKFCHETDHASYPTNASGPARTLEMSGQLLDEYNDASGRALAGFTKHAGKDHPLAADLNAGYRLVSDLGRMAVLCNLHSRCVAFNSNGWLKSSAAMTTQNSTVDFYVRTQPAAALIPTEDDSTPQFELNLLTGYPDAKCLDGSPGAYYSYRQPNVDRWLIYVEGGAWCFTAGSCASRAKGQLGSSLTYLKSFPRDSGHGHNPVLLGGITSSNCTVNPTFCHHNVIFIKYCDGASFTGSTSAGGLHYRGLDILTALLADLKTKQGISDASEVLLTGGSAGGMSVFLHADRVRESLELRPDAKFGAVPLSGFFLDRENVYDEPVFHGQAMGMYTLANSSGGVPRNCVAERPDDPASCIFSEHAFNSIESPIFVVDSTLDAYQIPCIMGRNGTASTWANSSCGAARDYENCTKIWGDRPLDKYCSRTQMYTLIEYQGSFMRKISTKKAWTKLNNGAFLYQCFTHVAANYPSFNAFHIDGVSMQQAVTRWWESLGKVDRDAVVYTDGIWGLDGVSTNPTCTY